MQQQRWIYERAGGKSWVAYQDRIQSGLLEHKVTTIIRNDGSEKIVQQVLVTPRGLTKLSSAISQNVSNGFHLAVPNQTHLQSSHYQMQ